MKKAAMIISLAFAVVLIVSMMLIPASAEDDLLAVAVYGTPEKIDGFVDDGWKNANTYKSDKVIGETFNSMEWKVMYDDTYLYFFADVRDVTVGNKDQEKPSADSDLWARDTVQIYLDLGYERTASGAGVDKWGKDNNDIQIDINARGYDYCKLIQATRFVEHAEFVTVFGYYVECRIDLGVYPEFKNEAGTRIGLDVWAADTKDYINRCGLLTWTGKEDTYNNSSLMGTLVLGEKPASAAKYDGLVKGKYLQSLGATLTPIANATGDHMKNIAYMTDGYKNSTYSGNIDTWGCTYTDDLGVWFGAEFEKEYDISQVIFWEGGHWADGGWFGASPKLQCYVDGEWKDVDFTLSPEYPGDSQAEQRWGYEPYFFTLDEAVSCSKIRVIGQKTSLGGAHASVVEIEVFAEIEEDDKPVVTPPDTTEPDTTDTASPSDSDTATDSTTNAPSTAPAVTDENTGSSTDSVSSTDSASSTNADMSTDSVSSADNGPNITVIIAIIAVAVAVVVVVVIFILRKKK